MSHDISRKQFLSLGVLGGLGLFGACALEETSPKVGSGGNAGSGGAGSTTSTATSGGAAGTSTSTSTTSATGTSGAGGSGGSTGSSGGAAGAGGDTGGSAGTDGTGGDGGGCPDAGRGGGSGGAGGAKDAGLGDAGACTGDVVATISLNHHDLGDGPHVLRIPRADIIAGVAKLYQTDSVPDIDPPCGPSAQSHSHWVRLTAADFMALRAGMTVTKRSCDSHAHQYVLRCGATPNAVDPSCGADRCGTEANPCP